MAEPRPGGADWCPGGPNDGCTDPLIHKSRWRAPDRRREVEVFVNSKGIEWLLETKGFDLIANIYGAGY